MLKGYGILFLWCIIFISYWKDQESLLVENAYSIKPIKINCDRYIRPLDYVTSKKYGFGQYLGERQVVINPLDEKKYTTPAIVIRFADTEIMYFEKLLPVTKDLYLKSSYEDGRTQLSTALNTKVWERKKARVVKNCEDMSKELAAMLAIRRSLYRIPSIPDNEQYKAFEQAFAYNPSPDQLTCFHDIANDMINRTHPMDRLICGDVGFGKTEVAMRAIYRAVLNKKQAAVLAPTRILASQHFQTMTKRMPDVPIRLLQGGLGSDALRIREELLSGECRVVIGTHALLFGDLQYQNLGLLVIDEEQRFGVDHKEKLKRLTTGVDILTLSATPIPRTMQMSLTEMKDCSSLQSPPVGRQEVKVHVGEEDDQLIKEAIENEMKRGGQSFIVVPFISMQEKIEKKLKSLIEGVKIIIVNGKQDTVTFDQNIKDFVNNQVTKSPSLSLSFCLLLI